MTFPKEGVKLDQQSFAGIGERIEALLAGGESYRLTLKPWRETRTLSQNAVFHMWIGEISAYLIRRGKPFASPEWVKQAMKHTYLGYEKREMTDVVTGHKTEIHALRSTSKLDTGKMFRFMEQVEGWAAMIGCLVTIPNDSEFHQLRKKQDA